MSNAPLTVSPAWVAAARRSIDALLAQADGPALAMMGARLFAGTSTDDDMTLMNSWRPLCEGVTPEQVARACWTASGRDE